jgi:hypothetical protein
LKVYKRQGVKVTQKELRSKLGYGSDVMTMGYKRARAEGVLN